MTLSNPNHEEGGFRYWVERDGMKYAGRHLLVDLWGASRLDSLEVVRDAILESVNASGTTLIDLTLHQFTPNGGVTGAAVLAQSHLCIHTWPEEGFVAVDLFVCGPADPVAILPVLKAAFRPERISLREEKRGLTIDRTTEKNTKEAP